MEGLSPRHLAFAALVKEIDGKAYDDISDEGLQRVVEVLGDAEMKDVTAESYAVKKKIDEELTIYFNDTFDSARENEYYDIMKRRAQLMLEAVTEGDTDERKAEIERMTDEMVMFVKPKKFSGRDSAEIKYDKQYDELCLMMSQHLHQDPKKYTVLEYYNAYNFIKKSLKRQTAQNKGDGSVLRLIMGK